ncbi:MAG: hypothetical protein DRN15_07185 [Thermoprotei archaeon]|nr:MAG: hypothetical protein DRN15_07185 [Thermoprotei archaeon]
MLELLILATVYIAYIPLHEACHIIMLKLFKKQYCIKLGLFIRVHIEGWTGKRLAEIPKEERFKVLVVALAPYLIINLPIILLLPVNNALHLFIKLYFIATLALIPFEFL